MNSQSIWPASCTSSCLMLMIWSSRARNRSPDPVVSCFFGRIAPSDAATESCFSIRGNRENEFASFQGLRHGNLAISSQQSRQKTTLAQWVRNSSRATSSSHQEPSMTWLGPVDRTSGTLTLSAGTLSCLAHHGTPLSERCPTTTALERTTVPMDDADRMPPLGTVNPLCG